MSGRFSPQFKAALDTLVSERPLDLKNNDPVFFCHRYSSHNDIEIAALIASSFAYGNVRIILKDLAVIFARIGDSPSHFIDNFDISEELRYFSAFKHRFNDGRDLCALFTAIRGMRRSAGNIESFFATSAKDRGLSDALSAFCNAALAFDYSKIFGAPAPSKSFSFLFPSPQSGSACKRLCMFLRWMVRPSDGVDFGIWKTLSPAELVIPVDTHVCRIASLLGLTSRKNGDWKMALEITESLKSLDPLDPVKYDFAIAHIGISGNCDGKSLSICKKCIIRGICGVPFTNNH